MEGEQEVRAPFQRLQGPEEESPQAVASPAGLTVVQVRVVQARVPTAQVDLQDPSPDVPIPDGKKACRVPSRQGVGVASRRDEEVSSRRDVGVSNRGVEVSSRRGADPSLLEEAASHRDEVPNPAAVVLLVPSREEEVLSVPILQLEVVPNHQAEKGPIHPAVEAIRQEVEDPSLQAEVGPSPADPCRMEVRLHPAVP